MIVILAAAAVPVAVAVACALVRPTHRMAHFLVVESRAASRAEPATMAAAMGAALAGLDAPMRTPSLIGPVSLVIHRYRLHDADRVALSVRHRDPATLASHLAGAVGATAEPVPRLLLPTAVCLRHGRALPSSAMAADAARSAALSVETTSAAPALLGTWVSSVMERGGSGLLSVGLKPLGRRRARRLASASGPPSETFCARIVGAADDHVTAATLAGGAAAHLGGPPLGSRAARPSDLGLGLGTALVAIVVGLIWAGADIAHGRFGPAGTVVELAGVSAGLITLAGAAGLLGVTERRWRRALGAGVVRPGRPTPGGAGSLLLAPTHLVSLCLPAPSPPAPPVPALAPADPEPAPPPWAAALYRPFGAP